MAYRQTLAAFSKLLPLLFLLLPQAVGSQTVDPSTAAQKGGGMEAVRHIQSDQPEIPDIDRQASANFETATFGLG